MTQKETGRDYPLSETPEPKFNFSLQGGGDRKNYNVNASANIPIYKGFSVGVNKSFNKNEEGSGSRTSYSASLNVPLKKRK